jgi:ribosomal protein S6
MVRYEVLILASPDITSDETAGLESEFGKVVRKNKGELISFERWGKLLLAYPVNNNDYGVYFLGRFDVSSQDGKALLEELRMLFTVKLLNVVMRYLTTHLDSSASLEYSRPDSLEDTPTRDVDTFLRENKMEGLMGSSNDDEDDMADDSEGAL